MASTTEYEVNDSKLVYLVSENNEDAKDVLLEKYSPMIYKEINRVKKSAYVLGIDKSDLEQEAMLAFTNAIADYDERQDATFFTFASLCVRRKLLNYIRKCSSGKEITEKNAIHLDSLLEEDNSMTLLDVISDVSSKEPLNQMLAGETIEELSKKIDKELSNSEREALMLNLSGKSIDEIAKYMNSTSKQVYNLLYRARNKLKTGKNE